MAQRSLKRKLEDLNSNNDNLNDDEFDVTWGGKKSRYMYNYTLQSLDVFSKPNDTDETESVYSFQSKSTMEIVSEQDLSSDKSCGSDCDCSCSQYSCQSDHTEFDVASSSSSSCHNINDPNSSDSFTSVDYEVPKNIACDEPLHISDNGYFADDTDIQVPSPKIYLPPPACFKTCVQCKQENPNPYFQYCYPCYKYRMEFFENKPKPKKRRILKISNCRTSTNSVKYNQASSSSSSQQFNKLYMHNVYPSRNNIIDKSINIGNNSIEMIKRTKNLCNICLIMPKNGIFHHGKISHVYCCYSCANKMHRNSNKCPICKVKLKYVTKMMDDLNGNEYDVIQDNKTFSNNEVNDLNSLDFSTLENHKVSKNIKEYSTTLRNNDKAGSIGTQIIVKKEHLIHSAYFKICMLCRKDNSNPYFQYCSTCFKHRIEYFENKPMPKSIKRLIERFSQKETGGSEHIKNNFIEEAHKKNEDLCNICFMMPRNGVFNHGKISHIYCCYLCAKKVQRKFNKCPICNLKLKFVTKIV